MAPSPPTNTPEDLDRDCEFLREDFRTIEEQLRLQNDELRATEAELRVQHHELMEALANAERERFRYRELFELAPNAYVVTDAIGTILEANSAATELLGWQESCLAGARLGIFVCEHQRVFFTTHLELAHEDHKKLSFEAEIETKGGGKLLVLFTVTPSRGFAAQVPELRWLIRDVAESLASGATRRKPSHGARESKSLSRR